MNTLQLFKQAFFQVSELRHAKKMAFWKVILYAVFLSAILALPITKQVFSVLQEVQQDGQKIAEKLPDFSIENGTLQTKAKESGFIYQTDSIIFTFDPDGKRTAADVQKDLIGNAFGLAFLQDEFVVALPNSGATESILGTDQFIFPYSKGTLDGVNAQSIKTALSEAAIPWWTKLIVFLVAIYPVLIGLVLDLLIAAIGASLYSKLRFYSLRLIDCLKIITYCATVPVILSAILNFVNPMFNDGILVILLSLFFFFVTPKTNHGISLVLKKRCCL